MEIMLPKLSDSSDEITITLWHASEKDTVAEGQDLLEVSTDKATFDVPAPCKGILKSVLKGAGETIRPGEIIGEIV